MQKTYLMGLIEVMDVQRRRHGSYEDPNQSRRQSSVVYHVPNGKGENVQVCRQTFIEIFGTTKSQIENLIKRKKMGDTVYVEKRGKFEKPKKFTDEHRTLIVNQINKIPRCESHYSRAKSSREYVSPELNVHRLYKALQTENPNTLVTYKFYTKVFKEEFPKLSFRPPRSDTCRVCDELACKIKASKKTSELMASKAALEIHHRKAERAFALLKQNAADSQLPGSNQSTICIDLQQVLFVPTLVHSDMFYKRQLSCYNFCVHTCDTDKAIMCMWHEGVAQRGSNEIISCLLQVFNTNHFKDSLVVWSDNCSGQNKNRVMIFFFMYLVAIGLFIKIEHKFLLSGHSFLPCDRDFALIEKRKKCCKAFVPSELKDIVLSSTHNKKFEVIEMMKNKFFEFQSVCDNLINTKNINVSKVSMIKYTANGRVETKKAFSEVEDWQLVNVFKKGKSVEDLKKVELVIDNKPADIKADKKQNLLSMIPFLDEKYKDFYLNLCK